MSSKTRGLTGAEARERLAHYGPNALPEKKARSFALRFISQFRSALIYILLVALVLDLGIWLHEGAAHFPVEPITILLILLANAFLGMWQERKAEAALATLKAMSEPMSDVLRDGQWVSVPATELVPGDWLRVAAGQRIPADGQLCTGRSLLIDESVLTGESVPVEKVDHDAVFSGTLCVRGSGEVLVEHTGEHSNMGKLAGMLEEIRYQPTPLERRLQRFGNRVGFAVIALAILIVLFGSLITGVNQFGLLFMFAVALAVAAVPEGLPAMITLALSLGVERMATRKAVVRRLNAVEALGSITVIATDKTGTLTENRMIVKQVHSDSMDETRKAMILVNDEQPGSASGSTLERSLLDHAAESMDVMATRAAHPRISEKPFDAEWKYMRVTVESAGKTVAYLKGAPEVLLKRCALEAAERDRIAAEMSQLADEGYRLLAFAAGEGESEEHLRWLGYVQLWDPPRAEVADAIRSAREAGIRVLMFTGDHPGTAQAIARKVGIEEGAVMTGPELEEMRHDALLERLSQVSVFARVKPEHKLRLVQLLKEAGETVAVTGDGVNDAPALKAADVGVAMGIRGSDVSREVADLVLMDDNFATIVHAIEEGRGIYENIQKFIRSLFCANLTETLLICSSVFIALWAYAGVGDLFLPLTAAQILWINLVTDSIPTLSLSMDRTKGLMRRPPRATDAHLLDRPSLFFILAGGLPPVFIGIALLELMPLYGFSAEAARATLFNFIVLVQLALVFPARRTSTLPQTNRYLLAAVLLCSAVQLTVMYLPMTQEAFALHALNAVALLMSVAGAALAWGIGWVCAEWLRSRHPAGVDLQPGAICHEQRQR